jgi:hypothetical protein
MYVSERFVSYTYIDLLRELSSWRCVEYLQD